MKRHFLLLSMLSVIALIFTACSKDDSDSSYSNDSIKKDNLQFPAPKGGASIIINHYSVLNDKSGIRGLNYSVEWDTEKKAQRWSCYKMYNTVNANNVQRYSAQNDGSLSPTCQYPNDQDVDAQYRLTVDPYKSSGYDHGHICPSADRLSSSNINYQTFYITNMQPQLNKFNAGIWADMESQVRIWAGKFDTLYVCKGGTIDKAAHIYEYLCNSSHQSTRVNLNYVPVPKYFFMAVLGRTGNNFKATAFWIDQRNYSSTSLRSYVKTVGELQQETGIDFFCNLPDDIENQVENVTHVQMQREWEWFK